MNINKKIENMKARDPERAKDYNLARKKIITWSDYRKRWVY